MSPEHPSVLALHAYAAGLPEADTAGVRDHLAGCSRCREEVRALETAHGRFDQIEPTLRSAVRRRLTRRRSWLGLLVSLSVGTLATVAILARPADDSARVAVKGGLIFKAFARRAQTVFAVREGTTVAPGDEVRFVVESAGRPYLLVASVDGRGDTTVYFPFGGAWSGRIERTETPVELPGSAILDDAPGPERIFALATSEPLAAPKVLRLLAELGRGGAQAIRTESRLGVPAALQSSLLLEKAVSEGP